MARSWRAAVFLALLATAATSPALADSLSGADALLRRSTSALLANPLGAASRSQVAPDDAVLRFARSAVLRAHARNSRILAEGEQTGNDEAEMSAGESCLSNLPCMLAIVAAASNTTVYGITSLAACPITAAEAANCYYVRVARE